MTTILPIDLDGTLQHEILVDDSILITKAVIGENKSTIGLTTKDPVPGLRIGATTVIDGETFTINTTPRIERSGSSGKLSYSFTLEGPIYRWLDKIVMRNGLSDFTYYGSARDILQIFIDNVNEIEPGWTVGEVVETEPEHISFNDQSCRSALSTLLDQFKLEFYPSGNGKTINIVKKVGKITPYTFSYGKGNGLYSLSRTAIEDKNIVTKVYGYGSTRNLPLNYRGGLGRLTFTERFLSKNTNLYGIKEGTYTDEEIYPRRLGVVTAVSAYNDTASTFTISDSSLDFNLSDQIDPRLDGLVSFKTGELAGGEFVITEYDHTTKVITLKKSDSTGETLPNSTYQPAVGDTYVFLDIEMPQSYIDAAEIELKTRTEEYSNENSIPRVAYSLVLDPRYMRQVKPVIKPGDKIRIIDQELGIDTLIRIASMTYPVVPIESYSSKAQISLVIADFIPYTTQERLKADTIENKKDIKVMTRATADVKAQIDNAKSTLERVKGITNFLTTTIDGNVVATGTMLVGDALGNNTAGITGVVDQEGTSVWLWGGAPYASRYNADFRVLKNGMVYATRLKLGYGSVGGVSTGWDVTPSGIISDPTEPGAENFALLRGSSKDKEFSFGTELNPSSAGSSQSLTGRIRNARQETSVPFPTTNTALRVEASGANKNIALDIVSGAIQVGAEQGMNGTLNISVAEGTYPGAVGHPPITISAGDSDNVLFKVVNGLIVGNVGRPT